MSFFKKIKKLILAASPQLRKRLLYIGTIVFILNLFIFIYSVVLLHVYPTLLGLLLIAYGLGLRHAVDADHIAAIDNATRKLMRDGQKPVGVGFFFSLGHSTIVILLSVLLAFSTAFIKQRLPMFQHIGTIVGLSISSFFLILIGLINLIIFIDLFRNWRSASNMERHEDTSGLLTRVLKPLIRSLSRSWQMYFVGLLFGLGFDTASEIGLLSISATTGSSTIPIIHVLMLPIAFTAGMALVDTLDGMLMLGAYGWAYIDPVRKLYYNLNITLLSVIVAFFIGGFEAIQLFFAQFHIQGRLAKTIEHTNFNFLGYVIITIFVTLLAGSYLLAKRQKIL